MKYVVCFTGRSFQGDAEIASHLDAVRDALLQRGDSCESMFYRMKMGSDQPIQNTFAGYMKHAFSMIDDADALIGLMHDSDTGLGEAMEIGYAKALGTPIFVASHERADVRHLQGLMDHEIKYASASDLRRKVLDLPAISRAARRPESSKS
jgi:nucleoside 2-deoxyribosyltransferase